MSAKCFFTVPPTRNASVHHPAAFGVPIRPGLALPLSISGTRLLNSDRVFAGDSACCAELRNEQLVSAMSSERFRRNKRCGERLPLTHFRVGSVLFLYGRENRLRSDQRASPQLHQE